MNYKAITLLFGIFLLQFLAACCRDVQFFDYDEMMVRVSGVSIALEESLTIELYAKELEYLGGNQTPFGLSPALAVNCDEGWGGMKYPLENIEITSSAPFNAEFAANENLASLFQIETFLGQGETAVFPLIEVLEEPLSVDHFFLYLNERPTEFQNHVFQFRLTRSNGAMISVSTEEILWE